MFNKKILIGLISAIVVICLLAVSLAGTGIPFVSPIANSIVGAVGNLVSKPAEVLGDFSQSLSHLMTTYEENQSLKSKIDTVSALQAQLAEAKAENAQLKDELNLKATLSEYNTINASVIGRNPDSWQDQIIINVGSNDGIETGMVVMSGQGTIDRVTEVTLTSSKVMLMSNNINQDTALSAIIQLSDGGSVYGVVSGYDPVEKAFIMRNVDGTAAVEEGQKVITSGLGGVAPSTLFIGTVKKSMLDQYGLFKEVYITPAGELQNIRYVTVVKRGSERGGQ